MKLSHHLAVTSLLLAGCTIEGPSGGTQSGFEGRSGRDEHPEAEPIKGGAEAFEYEEAALVNMMQNGYQISSCSGSVVAPRVVLTAGHCVVGGFTGYQVIAPYAQGGQTATGSQAVVYDYTSTSGYVNPSQHDIGLILLDSPITLDVYPKIATAPVPSGTPVRNIGRKQNGYLSSSKLYIGAPLAVYPGASYGYPLSYVATEVIEPGDSGGPDVVDGPAPRTIVAVNSGAGGGTEILARTDLVASFIAEQIAIHGGAPPDPDPSDPSDPPQEPPGSCAHALCVEDAPLAPSCDPCVASICAADPFCCQYAWDYQCVSEVSSICGQSTCDQSSSGCGGLSYVGACQGDVLSWCEQGAPKTVSCSAQGKSCGWNAQASYWDCL